MNVIGPESPCTMLRPGMAGKVLGPMPTTRSGQWTEDMMGTRLSMIEQDSLLDAKP